MILEFESTEEYYDFVENLWGRNLQVDGSPPEFVAKRVVAAGVQVGGETTMYTQSEPWWDERVAPMAILVGSKKEYPPEVSENDFRTAAVKVLTADMESYRSTL